MQSIASVIQALSPEQEIEPVDVIISTPIVPCRETDFQERPLLVPWLRGSRRP